MKKTVVIAVLTLAAFFPGVTQLAQVKRALGSGSDSTDGAGGGPRVP